MKGLRALAALGLVLGLVWLLLGRGWGPAPSLQLIQVRDVTPRDVELGDRIAISGEGFPSGKPARVTFRGTLHRPGSPPLKGAEVSVWGTAVAPDKIEVAFDDASEALFCGAWGRSAHTTFEGDLEVAFTSALPNGPPIGGVLSAITFDLRPGTKVDAALRDREGARLLAFLGLRVLSSPGAAGLAVDAVAAGSRAMAAGIVAGDVIESFDGVRIASLADVVPAPGEREASVTVWRAAVGRPIHCVVGVTGFRGEAPPGLLTSALIVLAALGIVLLYAAPTPPAIAAWLQATVSRLRANAFRRGPRGSLASVVAQSLSDMSRDVVPEGGAPAVVDIAACALVALLPFGRSPVASSVDVGILFFVATTVLVAAAAASPGSVLARVRLALHVALQHAPAAVAVACVVIATGSLRVQEVARAQGSLPWDWQAFRSPASLVAFVLLLSSARIDFRSSVGAPQRPGVTRPADAPAQDLWLRAAFRGHRILVAGLAAVLFLGGWSLPGSTPAEQDARGWLEVAGAALLIAKTAAVVLGTAWSRWVVVPTALRVRSRLTALWLLPVAGLTLGAAAAWDFWSLGHWEQTLVSTLLFMGTVLCLAALAHRLGHGLLSSASGARLSPIL